MKVSLDAGLPLRIHSYDTNSITLSGMSISNPPAGALYDPETGMTTFRHSLILTASGHLQNWEVEDVASLDAERLAPLVQLESEIILIGTGEQQVFPQSTQLSILLEKNIGYETMSTAAACRTYNILASEGRLVTAALIIPGEII